MEGGIYGGVDKDGKVIVSKVEPLAISYINCQSGERTIAKGYSVAGNSETIARARPGSSSLAIVAMR